VILFAVKDKLSTQKITSLKTVPYLIPVPKLGLLENKKAFDLRQRLFLLY
jgi:hypothetical protein